MRSFNEYNLLVLRMPTSRDFLPDRPNFLFLPRNYKLHFTFFAQLHFIDHGAGLVLMIFFYKLSLKINIIIYLYNREIPLSLISISKSPRLMMMMK